MGKEPENTQETSLRKQTLEISFNALLLARGLCTTVFLAPCSLLPAPPLRPSSRRKSRAWIPRRDQRYGLRRPHRGIPAGYRELGYVEGKNVAIERRFAEGKTDRLSELADELVRLKVDILVSAGPTVTRLLKQATSTIPIVMTNEGDPVGSGFVASLARPGGNIAGLSSLAPELSGKRLEVLKETVPKFSRVAVLGNSTEPSNPQSLKEVELAAGAFGVKVQYLDILSPKDIEIAFRAAIHSDISNCASSINLIPIVRG